MFGQYTDLLVFSVSVERVGPNMSSVMEIVVFLTDSGQSEPTENVSDALTKLLFFCVNVCLYVREGGDRERENIVVERNQPWFLWENVDH